MTMDGALGRPLQLGLHSASFTKTGRAHGCALCLGVGTPVPGGVGSPFGSAPGWACPCGAGKASESQELTAGFVVRHNPFLQKPPIPPSKI